MRIGDVVLECEDGAIPRGSYVVYRAVAKRDASGDADGLSGAQRMG